MIRMYRKMDRKSVFIHTATWWSSTLESNELYVFSVCSLVRGHVIKVRVEAAVASWWPYNQYTANMLGNHMTWTTKEMWNKMEEATEVYKATHNLTPPYITSLFCPKTVTYDLRSNMPISQPQFQTLTHGYHSLRNEGTRLWAALPNACKEAKDISIFKRIVVDFIYL